MTINTNRRLYIGQNRLRNATLAFIVTLVVSAPAYSVCEIPVAPNLPDPNKAVLAEMIKAQNDAKLYIKLSNDCLRCMKDDDKRELVENTLREFSIRFNNTIRSYKARVTQTASRG